MGNDHGTNKPEDTNDAEEQRRKDVIIKEENKKAAFQGYLSIKDFFVDYIYGDKTVNNEQGIDRYLISIKSIPHFSKLIAEMSAEKIDNLEQLKNEEKKLKNKLLDYKIENNIKISGPGCRRRPCRSSRWPRGPPPRPDPSAGRNRRRFPPGGPR